MHSGLIIYCCSLPADWCSGGAPVSSSPEPNHGADSALYLLLSAINNCKEGVSDLIGNNIISK